MSTTIGEICNREVVITTPDTTAAGAAKLMREHHVGSLVVVDSTQSPVRTPVGLITDRDIVIAVMAMDLDPTAITVGDIMPRELTTARESDGFLQAIDVMRAKGVRRLPIVGGDGPGHLVGIVALDDLLEILAEQVTAFLKIISHEQSREADVTRGIAPHGWSGSTASSGSSDRARLTTRDTDAFSGE